MRGKKKCGSSPYCESSIQSWPSACTRTTVAWIKTLKRLWNSRTGSKLVRQTPEEVVDESMRALAKRKGLHLVTGMPPAEVCEVRPCEIDRSEEDWISKPVIHKTEHHGRSRIP